MALADRIAVLNFGVLQQVGTPTELFDQPANQFVAGFIGTPPMNFVQCHLEQEGDDLYARGQGFSVRLPADKRRKLLADGGNETLVLGIRPMDVRISKEQGDDTPIATETFVYEPQGETCQATVRLDDQLINIETIGISSPRPENRCGLDSIRANCTCSIPGRGKTSRSRRFNNVSRADTKGETNVHMAEVRLDKVKKIYGTLLQSMNYLCTVRTRSSSLFWDRPAQERPLF